ncbi:hypothetical protein SFRURICE_015942 [Spodoptera frugiperda]|nr:hypothetical protein SFRURICE_015942 [Spodoptera frugiperda]
MLLLAFLKICIPKKPRPPIHHFIIMMKSSQGYLYYYPLISYILPINKKIHCFVVIFQKKKTFVQAELRTAFAFLKICIPKKPRPPIHHFIIMMKSSQDMYSIETTTADSSFYNHDEK